MLCATILWNLKEKNLCYKSQKFALKDVTAKQGFMILNLPHQKPECKLPICQLSFFCLHNKPSVQKLYERLEKKLICKLQTCFEK